MIGWAISWQANTDPQRRQPRSVNRCGDESSTLSKLPPFESHWRYPSDKRKLRLQNQKAVSSESGYELLGASLQELKTSVKRKEDKTGMKLVGKVLDLSIAVLARRQNHQVALD